MFQPRGNFGAQAGHGFRKLVAASRRLAQPERHGRRHPLRVLHAHDAALDPPDPIALVAELKDVPREALDREVLVQGADEMILGLEQNLIIGIVGNGAA